MSLFPCLVVLALVSVVAGVFFLSYLFFLSFFSLHVSLILCARGDRIHKSRPLLLFYFSLVVLILSTFSSLPLETRVRSEGTTCIQESFIPLTAVPSEYMRYVSLPNSNHVSQQQQREEEAEK